MLSQRLRVAFLLFLGAVAAIVVACSDDDPQVTPNNPQPEAGPTPDPGDGSSTVPDPDNFPFEKGAKIDNAKQNEWTWVDFPDSTCANGTPTGIGVNLGTSKRLVIFMEGGGACWNTLTCYVAQTATYISAPFNKAAFESRMNRVDGSLFDRTLPDNTFKDDSFVYVPYCTGDVHGGNKEQQYDPADPRITKHFGRKNFEAFLKRIVPTFEDKVDRVIMSGSSAGGFGSALNYWKAAYVFPKIRVDLVDDSGPPFPADKIRFLTSWREAWDLDGILPPGCKECKTELKETFPYYLKKYPKSRFALLSYTQDQTISQFYQLDGPGFEAELLKLATTFQTSNSASFIVPGSRHTMLGELRTLTDLPPKPTQDAGSDGGDAGTGDAGDAGTQDAGDPGVPAGASRLSDWLKNMVTDDATWKTVGVPK
jgi:hypothetical protein